jgi:hypothetical protein
LSNAAVLRGAIKVIEANIRMGWPVFQGMSRELLWKAIQNSKQPAAWLLKIIAATGGRAAP